MRLFEIVFPPLYLCTSAKLKIGSVASQSSVYRLGATIEGQLDGRRPKDRLSRHSSLYLHTGPCGDAPYVYLVQPVGEVERHHTSWLKMLGDTDLRNIGEFDAHAVGYWSGKPHPDHQGDAWEYRAARVKVLKRVGGTEIVL